MQCKVTPAAKKQILAVLKDQTDKDLKIRVYVTEMHGDHAHYGVGLDHLQPGDVVNATTPGVEVLLERNTPSLDGIVVDFDPAQGAFMVTNPKTGHHHH